MKKQLLSTSGSLLRLHGPPVTPAKQHQKQQHDANPPASPARRTSLDHAHDRSIPLSPPLRLHVRQASNLVHMLVSPTLSTGSRRISSVSSASSASSAASAASTILSSPISSTSPTYCPKTPSPSTSCFSAHSRTLSLPCSPVLSRRSWANRLSLSFQALSLKRTYSHARSPLFEILTVPKENDYAGFESWERSLRLYLCSQELGNILDSDNDTIFTDSQCLKAKKAIQMHVCDSLKMEIQRFDTPAEIFAFLRRLCLPVDGKALGDTMVKLATAKLVFEPSIVEEVQNLDDVAAVKKFNKAFKGRLWAIGQVGSPMNDDAAASMYLGAVEKEFEPWRMSMLWMDLSLGIFKLESLMGIFEDGKNIKAWKKKGTAAGLLCWAENMGKEWSTRSLSSVGPLEPIAESRALEADA